MQRVGKAASGRRDGSPIDGAEARQTAISELVGRVVGEYLGHQSKARAYLNEDVITVVFEDMLTKGEARLVHDGMSELVLRMRGAFQQAMREDLISRVETMTGQKVRLTASEMTSEMTVEVFVLGVTPGTEATALELTAA
jgi:uncharacterized protein YbcI